MDSGRSHSMWHYFWVGISVAYLNVTSILVAQERRPLDCGEWGANSKHPDEWESIHSVITGQLSQGQRGSHTIHRVWETLEVREFYEKQIFSVYELSQEIFLLFNFLLCSLMCEMYITLQWCFSAHRDKGKTFWFFFFFGCTESVSCMAISLFETSGGYSLLAGCMASHCGGFFCCGAQALGTWASVVLL